MKTIAIIPAFNETDQLHEVIEKSSKHVDHVLVVDDGSTKFLETIIGTKPKLSFIRHPINLGKGAALKTGVFWAKKKGYDIAIFLDGDGQHNPEEIPELLKPLVNGTVEMALGRRTFHSHMPFVARFGNRFLSIALKFLFAIRVEDSQSGYRALRLTSYKKIQWESPRYAVETEMIVNAGKSKLQFVEVPISTIYHDRYKGTTVIDGFRILIKMLTWKII